MNMCNLSEGIYEQGFIQGYVKVKSQNNKKR